MAKDWDLEKHAKRTNVNSKKAKKKKKKGCSIILILFLGAVLAGVGAGVFTSVKEACKNIETDKVFEPSGADYKEIYENFIKYDNILNVRGE